MTLGIHNVVHDAQTGNLPLERALARLADSISTLKDVRFVLRNQTPTKERRAELRRQLAGVVADCEMVRLAIED